MIHMTTSHQNEIMVVSAASTGTGATTARELAEKEFEQWRYSFAVTDQQRRQGADNDEHR